ncbi:hypothetical protein BE11_21825 [Sorangium cellulosum]|nr:hypothetical protein BE11_21825 [Sorangium cellulosum]
MSDMDIDAGERWAVEIGKELEACNFGIICLTEDNVASPWILFEAGALSKQMPVASICPYLIGLDFSGITGPLAQFQAKKAQVDHTLDLLHSINKRAAKPIDTERLAMLFERLWPVLERGLQSLPAPGPKSAVARSTHEIMEELVGTVRVLDHRFNKLNAAFHRIEAILRYATDEHARAERDVIDFGHEDVTIRNTPDS